jgi:integrase
MRVEEIARLRAREDIQVKDGIPCFVLQQHPDGWTPKTEAGERVVPVHSCLVELGLLDLVERRREAECYRLFADLNPGGPDKKLSTEFSRKFSKHKAALGVGRKTCFHSFRHSVRTMLANTEAELRDIWIDSVMGHAADEKSEGERTYTKRISVKFLRRVIDAIQPDVDLNHLRRGGRK